jgi:hypothetical protein
MYTNTLLDYAMLSAEEMAKKKMTTERVEITWGKVDKWLELILEPIFSDETRDVVRKKLYIEASGVDAVSDYLLLINAMFGYSAKERLHRINMLLAEIENRARAKKSKVDPNNPIVKTLRLQQLLLWNDMSPLERDHLDPDLLAGYGLLGLYNYFKDQPVTQNEWPDFNLNWNGENINLNLERPDGAYALTPAELRKLAVPQQLKDTVFREMAKRDILRIIKTTTATELEAALWAYFKELPSEYKAAALIPILFSEVELDANGVRGQDPIPRNVKGKFISERLKEIDFRQAKSTDEKNTLLKTYAGEYATLWQAYELIIYKEVGDEISDLVRKIKADKNDRPSVAALAAIKQKLTDLTTMMDIMLPTGLNLTAGSSDGLAAEFVAAKDAYETAFVKHGSLGEKLSMKADILNYLYWLGHDLETLEEDGSAGISLRERAADLLDVCKQGHSDWETNDKFIGVDFRLALQEKYKGGYFTLEQIEEDLRNLWLRQATAKDYGNKREYAYFLLTEAFIYSITAYTPPDLPDDKKRSARYTAIKEDEILKQFDYMLTDFKNMQSSIERNSFGFSENTIPEQTGSEEPTANEQRSTETEQEITKPELTEEQETTQMDMERRLNNRYPR